MLQAILFVLACLALQALKDACCGRRRPTVRLLSDRDGLRLIDNGLHATAQCGCRLVDMKVTEPCEAHKAMRGA